MTAALFGELTATGDQIALVAAGADDIDLKMIATRLQHLTAAGKHPRNDDGSLNMDVLLVPATWPTVVQIGHMFTGNGSGAAWSPPCAACTGYHTAGTPSLQCRAKHSLAQRRRGDDSSRPLTQWVIRSCSPRARTTS